MGHWQEIDHTADLALHVWADDLPDLFATAARGMFSLFTSLEALVLDRAVDVTLTALDVETLLVDWLNELLYLSEVEGTAFAEFDFTQMTSTALAATAHGGRISEYLSYVKAATFHNLAVVRTPDGYETEIVFDT